MKDSKTFTTFDIQRILGIKIDRQKDWMNRGFIEPSHQKATGQGTKNIFSLLDLYLIKLFHHLVEIRGFSRENAKGVVHKIKNDKRISKAPEHLFYGVLPEYIAFTEGDSGIRGFTGLKEVPKIFKDFRDIDLLIINFRVIVDMVDNAIDE